MTTHLTAVITGDNHLGTYYARLRPDRLHQRREALQAGFARAVQVALDEKAHLFLIVGDLFDRPDPRNSDRAFVARHLCRLRDAGIACIAICGNHDSPRLPGYDGGTVPLHEMAALDGLHLLRRDDDWDSVTLEVPVNGETIRVRVRGQSHSFAHAESTCPLDGDVPNRPRTAPLEIALLHYGVEGWLAPFVAEPLLARSNLDCLNADLIAVGHLHARNSTSLAGGALLVNPGATERMDWGEEKLATGCAVAFLRAGERPRLEWRDFDGQPMQTLDISADALQAACESDDSSADAATAFVNATIRQTLEKAGDVTAPRLMLRVRLTGSIGENTLHQLDTDAIRRFGAAHCFHTEVQTDDLTVRYADGGELPAGSGGVEIEAEIEAVVASLLQQAAPMENATEAERANAAYELRVLQGAKEALLGAYQRIAPGGSVTR